MMGIEKKFIIDVARVENPLKRILNALLLASLLTTEGLAVVWSDVGGRIILHQSTAGCWFLPQKHLLLSEAG